MMDKFGLSPVCVMCSSKSTPCHQHEVSFTST